MSWILPPGGIRNVPLPSRDYSPHHADGLIATVRCAAPARGGASVDERCIVGGNVGERGRETLIQSPLGLKVRRDRAHVQLGATKRGRGKSVMGAGPPSFAIAARGGAFVDERRIVGGNVGERGCE